MIYSNCEFFSSRILEETCELIKEVSLWRSTWLIKQISTRLWRLPYTKVRASLSIGSKFHSNIICSWWLFHIWCRVSSQVGVVRISWYQSKGSSGLVYPFILSFVFLLVSLYFEKKEQQKNSSSIRVFVLVFFLKKKKKFRNLLFLLSPNLLVF